MYSNRSLTLIIMNILADLSDAKTQKIIEIGFRC